MQIKQDEYDVGIIVGRFQVNELHQAHIDLIQSVCDEHAKVIIFLGLAPVINTKNNPLDFETRKQMIQAHFPDVTISYISDVHDDALWSKHLDKEIGKLLTPTQNAVLYGGRDSFITVYSGQYPTRELHQEVYVSGTDIRRSLSKQVKASADFRHGVVWAASNRFPTVFTTVDIAVFNDDYTKILLGRKELEDQYRLIGGFSDPRDESFEHAAARELREETGLVANSGVKDFEYLGSYRIDDWRYRSEVDKITTVLYAVRISISGPRPGDDIHELRWFDVKSLWRTTDWTDRNYEYNKIVPQHHEILARAWEYGMSMQTTNQG